MSNKNAVVPVEELLSWQVASHAIDPMGKYCRVVFAGGLEETFFRINSMGSIIRIDPESTEEIQTATTMTSGNKITIQAEVVYFTGVVKYARDTNVRAVLNSLIRKLLCANEEENAVVRNNELMYCDKVLVKLITCFDDTDVDIAIDQVMSEIKMEAKVLGEVAVALQQLSRELQQSKKVPQGECLRFLQQIIERCEVLGKTKKVS